ncbi:MAG: hypothetical protein IKX75_08630, partial [Desulfovibrio sp.]|nr:hypothetical protein [Desulfovibrio sp.]
VQRREPLQIALRAVSLWAMKHCVCTRLAALGPDNGTAARQLYPRFSIRHQGGFFLPERRR